MAGSYLETKRRRMQRLKTAAVLTAAALAFVLIRGQGTALTGAVLISDVCFALGMAYLIWGMIGLLGNLHMFTSFTYGVKSAKRLFRGERVNAREAKEDYLAYRNSRRHHDDVPFLLGVGAVLMMLSVAAAFLA